MGWENFQLRTVLHDGAGMRIDLSIGIPHSKAAFTAKVSLDILRLAIVSATCLDPNVVERGIGFWAERCLRSDFAVCTYRIWELIDCFHSLRSHPSPLFQVLRRIVHPAPSGLISLPVQTRRIQDHANSVRSTRRQCLDTSCSSFAVLVSTNPASISK